MASQYNATCDICGNPYHLCLSCKDIMALQPWKIHTDTAEHYKIYQVLHGYNTGVYNIAEAKAKLKTIDLSDKNNFVAEIKKVIDKIMAYKDEPIEKETIEVMSTLKKDKKKNYKKVETETVDD
jgi:hypothetical protein